MLISSQTFAFAPPQQGVTQVTQANVVSNVALDGSKPMTVPYLQPFAQYVQAVNITYTPDTETDYVLSIQALPIPPATKTANSLTGFILSVSGAPAGATGTFSYAAVGL